MNGVSWKLSLCKEEKNINSANGSVGSGRMLGDDHWVFTMRKLAMTLRNAVCCS